RAHFTARLALAPSRVGTRFSKQLVQTVAHSRGSPKLMAADGRSKRPAGRKFMPYTIVISGASGDLTSRKLVPALYSLYRKGRLPDALKIVGFSRTPVEDQKWRDELAESTAKF